MMCREDKSEPLHDNTNEITRVPSVDSVQPGYLPSVIKSSRCAPNG